MKMDLKRLIIFFSLIIILDSCKKDLDIITNYQEVYTVYCLLNPMDSANYVRINRAYQSSDSPWLYVNSPDSVNIHADEFEVKLLMKSNAGTIDKQIQMYPTYDFGKDSGLFATKNYQTFKTTTSLLPDKIYQLSIKHLTTGYEMQAETALLGRRNLDFSFSQQRCYTSAAYNKEVIDYEGSLAPNQFDIQFYRLLYLELTDNDTVQLYLNWKPYADYFKNTRPDSTQNQFTDDFLEYISENIEPTPNVKRIAIGVDKYLLLNDNNLSAYIQLMNSAASVHYIPDFTNFDSGKGIFASRYFYTLVPLKLRDDSYDTLSLGRYTKQLNFADSEGNWHIK